MFKHILLPHHRCLSALPLTLRTPYLRFQRVRAISDRDGKSLSTEIIGEVTFRPEMENTVQMVGFLGKDPEFFEFKTGTCKTVLLLGMKERRTKRNQWFEVAVWGPLAFTVRDEFSKGAEIYVHGKLEQNSWIDASSDKARSKVIIVAKSVHKLKYLNTLPYSSPKRKKATSSKEEMLD